MILYIVVSDTLDDIMTESGDEEESDAIVNQVLDEIGIEISGKVCHKILLVSSGWTWDPKKFHWKIATFLKHIVHGMESRQNLSL